MTKRLGEFATDLLQRVLVITVALALIPAVLDTSMRETRQANACTNDPVPCVKSEGPAGVVTIMWLDGWGPVAVPSVRG